MDFDIIEILEAASLGIATALIGTFYLAKENKKEIKDIKNWREKKDDLDNAQEKELIRLNEKVNGIEKLIVQKIDALTASFEAFTISINAKLDKYDKGIEEFWKDKPWDK